MRIHTRNTGPLEMLCVRSMPVRPSSRRVCCRGAENPLSVSVGRFGPNSAVHFPTRPACGNIKFVGGSIQRANWRIGSTQAALVYEQYAAKCQPLFERILLLTSGTTHSSIGCSVAQTSQLDHVLGVEKIWLDSHEQIASRYVKNNLGQHLAMSGA